MKIDVPNNLECFDNLSEEEASYFVGMLFADGCMRRPGASKGYPNSKQISLRLIDRDVIEHFCRFVGLNEERIGVDTRNREKPYYSINTSNMHITSKLYEIGIVEDKSHRELNIPEGINKIAFLRGYLEGDGCISGRQASFLSSSKDLIDEIDKEIQDLGFFTKRSEQKGKTTLYSVAIAKGVAETIRFLDKIYNTDLPVMDRKYQKYLEMKRNYQGQS